MKKRYIVSAVGGAIGASAASYLLMNKENRAKLKDNLRSLSNGIKDDNEEAFDTTFEDAGRPDQTNNKDLAQFENAKMVSEGSQFGVNYYNEVKANIVEKEKSK